MKNSKINKKEKIIKEMLKTIGDNPNREGLKDTPARIGRMWEEIFAGYNESKKPRITVFSNKNDGIHYDQMIMDTGYFFSHCEHHGVPFFGRYHFAYIPNEKIMGLSKVSRIVDFFSARLQIQERLVKNIVDEIERVVEPQGLALVLKARHLCKEMRGVKRIKSEMITTDLRGVFRNDPSTRSEFMGQIISKTNEVKN